MKILAISGSAKGIKTLTAVNEILKLIKEKDNTIETDVIDPSQYNITYSDGRDYRDYEGDTALIIQKIMDADAYVIGTPTYQASISGVLKNIFDLLPLDAFDGKVVGIVATAGSDKHYLMAEQQLKPILNYMKAMVVPKYVFINEMQFINHAFKDDQLVYRFKQLAEDVLDMTEIMRELHQRKNDAYDF